MSIDYNYGIRLCSFRMSINRSCGNAYTVFPLIPIIVFAATRAFTMASSVACAVAKNNGLIASFGSISVSIIPSRAATPGFAVENAIKIAEELQKFSPTLAKKERWLALNKVDLVDQQAQELLKKNLRKSLGWKGDIHAISALNKQGCEQLCNDLMQSIELHRQRL